MGIAKPAVEVLIQEAARAPFHGSIVTLGRQDVFVSAAVMSELASQSGVRLSNPTVRPAQKAKLAQNGCISDDTLFLSLGFSEYRSMDVSSYESADILFDLNQSALPQELENRFDVVLDGGTMEHVFHEPNALQNIFKLLKVGGRVIHLSPSSNHIDHGFYMFSPTLFWDFYSANQFEINRLALSRYTPQHDTGPYQLTPYTPGSLRSVSFGGLDNAMYGVVVVATKTSLSSGNKVPQQGAYIDQWKVKSVPEPAPSPQNLEDYVSAVFAALKKRDFAEAEVLSGKSVTQFERHPQSWLIRGIVLRLVNQMGPASEALQRSLRLEVTRDALTQLIHVCKASGRLEEMAALGNQLAGIGGAV